MNGFYRYIGLTKIKKSKTRKSAGDGSRGEGDKNSASGGEGKASRESKLEEEKNSALSNEKSNTPNVLGRGASGQEGGLNAGDKAINTVIGEGFSLEGRACESVGLGSPSFSVYVIAGKGIRWR